MKGHVGLKEGLSVTDGRVDVLKAWLWLYPGVMHAALQKLNNARLSKRADFGQVGPQEYIRLGGLMVAETIHSIRGRDLWENSNILDGMRNQPQFQKYMAFESLILFVL
jgi:hypothetical protein